MASTFDPAPNSPAARGGAPATSTRSNPSQSARTPTIDDASTAYFSAKTDAFGPSENDGDDPVSPPLWSSSLPSTDLASFPAPPEAGAENSLAPGNRRVSSSTFGGHGFSEATGPVDARRPAALSARAVSSGFPLAPSLPLDGDDEDEDENDGPLISSRHTLQTYASSAGRSSSGTIAPLPASEAELSGQASMLRLDDSDSDDEREHEEGHADLDAERGHGQPSSPVAAPWLEDGVFGRNRDKRASKIERLLGHGADDASSNNPSAYTSILSHPSGSHMPVSPPPFSDLPPAPLFHLNAGRKASVDSTASSSFFRPYSDGDTDDDASIRSGEPFLGYRDASQVRRELGQVPSVGRSRGLPEPQSPRRPDLSRRTNSLTPEERAIMMKRARKITYLTGNVLNETLAAEIVRPASLPPPRRRERRNSDPVSPVKDRLSLESGWHPSPKHTLVDIDQEMGIPRGGTLDRRLSAISTARGLAAFGTRSDEAERSFLEQHDELSDEEDTSIQRSRSADAGLPPSVLAPSSPSASISSPPSLLHRRSLPPSPTSPMPMREPNSRSNLQARLSRIHRHLGTEVPAEQILVGPGNSPWLVDHHNERSFLALDAADQFASLGRWKSKSALGGKVRDAVEAMKSRKGTSKRASMSTGRQTPVSAGGGGGGATVASSRASFLELDDDDETRSGLRRGKSLSISRANTELEDDSVDEFEIDGQPRGTIREGDDRRGAKLLNIFGDVPAPRLYAQEHRHRSSSNESTG